MLENANNLGVREGTHGHGKTNFLAEEQKTEKKEEGSIKEGSFAIKMEGKKVKTEKRSPFDYPAIAMYINEK